MQIEQLGHLDFESLASFIICTVVERLISQTLQIQRLRRRVVRQGLIEEFGVDRSLHQGLDVQVRITAKRLEHLGAHYL